MAQVRGIPIIGTFGRYVLIIFICRVLVSVYFLSVPNGYSKANILTKFAKICLLAKWFKFGLTVIDKYHNGSVQWMSNNVQFLNIVF